jgi:hypothetical protein
MTLVFIFMDRIPALAKASSHPCASKMRRTDRSENGVAQTPRTSLTINFSPRPSGGEAGPAAANFILFN